MEGKENWKSAIKYIEHLFDTHDDHELESKGMTYRNARSCRYRFKKAGGHPRGPLDLNAQRNMLEAMGYTVELKVDVNSRNQ